MLLSQIAYRYTIRLLALPLAMVLFSLRWKKSRILKNVRHLQIPFSAFTRFKLYFHASVDALELLHGHYSRTITTRLQDSKKIRGLKTLPSLFLSAHFHNWELMGSWLTQTLRIPLLSAAVPLTHPRSQLFLNWIRTRTQVPVVTKNIPLAAIHHLKQGKGFGILWDQFPLHQKSESRFFSRPIQMDALAPFLQNKTHVPVYFGALLPSGQFRIVRLFSPKHPTQKTVTGDLDLAPEKLSRRYNRVLEILVRAHPSFWYGFAHRRFKDQIKY